MPQESHLVDPPSEGLEEITPERTSLTSAITVLQLSVPVPRDLITGALLDGVLDPSEEAGSTDSEDNADLIAGEIIQEFFRTVFDRDPDYAVMLRNALANRAQRRGYYSDRLSGIGLVWRALNGLLQIRRNSRHA